VYGYKTAPDGLPNPSVGAWIWQSRFRAEIDTCQNLFDGVLLRCKISFDLYEGFQLNGPCYDWLRRQKSKVYTPFFAEEKK
jgi:hypothetical protein